MTAPPQQPGPPEEPSHQPGFPQMHQGPPGAVQAAPPGYWPPQPPPPAAKRKRLIVAAVVVGCVVLTVVGWLVWPSGSGFVSGTVQAGVLSSEEVSKVVGVTLASTSSISEPPPALPAEPKNCAAAVGPSTRSVYSPGWTAFLAVTHQESETVSDHSVTQVLGVYPDGAKASAVFRALADGLKGCTTALRTDTDQDISKWDYKVGSATPDTLAWSAAQEAGDGWACHRQARLKGNIVLQVAVCQTGDGGPAAAKIAAGIAERVGG